MGTIRPGGAIPRGHPCGPVPFCSFFGSTWPLWVSHPSMETPETIASVLLSTMDAA